MCYYSFLIKKAAMRKVVDFVVFIDKLKMYHFISGA